MGADKAYAATAMANRGKFTEEFSAKRFEKVFGKTNVFRNVKICDGLPRRASRRDRPRRVGARCAGRDVERLIDLVAGSGLLIAADIAELNPHHDRDAMTVRVAARLVA